MVLRSSLWPIGKIMKIISNLYALFDHPWFYSFSQFLLAPGAQTAVSRILKKNILEKESQNLLLDVGCGPSSWLSRIGFKPIGLDLSFEYVKRHASKGVLGVMATADQLPFADDYFDIVCSVFVFHHLPDFVASQAVQEMVRVCKPGGQVIIVDAIYPRFPWLRPLAYWLRRLDRGRFTRKKESFQTLLSSQAPFSMRKGTYSFNGSELLAGHLIK